MRQETSQNPASVRKRRTEQSRRWRAENLDRSRELNRQYQQRKMNFVREVLGTVCVDCAESRPGAIEYHHPQGRDYGHEHGLSGLSWPRIKKQIMLLIPLCATCHSVRHYQAKTKGRPRTKEVENATQ